MIGRAWTCPHQLVLVFCHNHEAKFSMRPIHGIAGCRMTMRDQERSQTWPKSLTPAGHKTYRQASAQLTAKFQGRRCHHVWQGSDTAPRTRRLHSFVLQET
eukprot:scaffold90514_cov50-Prasinocladus_malaysianus.AAC.1